MEEGEFFEAVRTIIHKRVSAEVHPHFIDRIHLVGVHAATAEITAIWRRAHFAHVNASLAAELVKAREALAEAESLIDEGRWVIAQGVIRDALPATPEPSAREEP